MMKIVSIIFLSVLLSACSMFSKTKAFEDYDVSLDITNSEILTLKDVEFIILTKQNNTQVLDKETVMFSLTESNYKALSENIEKIKNHLRLQKTIIQEYKKFYESKK